MTLPIWAGAACLSALAILAHVTARREPAWRRLARALSALAVIDAARASLAPYSQAMISPWWPIDVALFAAWPMAMAWMLRRAALDSNQGNSPGCPGSASDRPAPARRLHPTTLVALGYVILLGAARPWLPTWAHLAGQVAPRVVLAGVWVGAVWRMWKDEGREAEASRPRPLSGPSDKASIHASQRTVWRRQQHGDAQGSYTSTTPDRLPQLAALLLAGCDVAAAAVAWSPALRGVAPAWPVARGLTLAGYVACAVVMGRAATSGKG